LASCQGVSDSRCEWWTEERLLELAGLLTRVWDPVGVGTLPNGDREYLDVARALKRPLSGGGEVDEVHRVLLAAGLGNREPDDRNAAIAVVRWHERAAGLDPGR